MNKIRTFNGSGLTLFFAIAVLVLFANVSVAQTADEALNLLKEGNTRFSTGTPIHPNTNLARVAELVAGQKPFAVVLTCSDSRVSPEIIFDRGLGDIFVIRDAGNVVDPIVTGSVEYATGHLHTPLVVVMGHTHCGAVEAALGSGHAEGGIGQILNQIEPSVESVKHLQPDLSGRQLSDSVVRANVKHSIDELLKFSAELREAAEKGIVKIVGAIYDIESGKVEWLSTQTAETK